MKLYSIGDLPENEYAKFGGKARGLDFLKRRKFNVPDAFVLAETGGMTEREYAEAERAFARLGAERVSVRSSATDEDGADYSGAGQYETRLNVTGEELRQAIGECLASARGERAQAYAKNLSNGGKAEMNLVVQAMVDAKAAGVMFSADPMQGGNVLIESVDGLGENLVSGAVAAYRYSFPKERFTYSGEGNLSEELLSRIYRQGMQIAAAYGGDVDLEWAVDSAGRLYWLQLRPITATGDALDEFDTKNPLSDHLITTRNIGEMMPGAVTPLSISTSVLAIDYGMRYMLYKTGAIKSVDAVPDYYTAFAVKNHLFIDMTALHSMSLRVAVASPEAMNMSIMGEAYENYPPVHGKKAFALTRACNAARFGKYLFSSKQAKKQLLGICEKLQFSDSGSASEIYSAISANLHYMNEALCCHYVCSSYSGAMNSALSMMLADTFEEKAAYQSFVSSVLSDIDGIESADILAMLRSLAAIIRKEVKGAESFDEQSLLAYVTDPSHAEAYALYAEFLRKHGHRSIKEAELRSKAWKNDQLSLMKNLHTVLAAGEDVRERKPFNMEEVLSVLPAKKRKSVGWIAERARRAVIDREFSKSNIIRVIDRFKDEYFRLAQLLVQDGALVDADSIYFLSHEEIGRLISGETSLKRKALVRRASFAEAEALTFDDVCVGRPQPRQNGGAHAEGALGGIPVCKGRAYGRARIVRSPQDAEQLARGEIMVAPFTDIGWSPYYSLIGALVTEVGSTLSHGAVVAREYCLPTVVNVKNATCAIRTGDYLLVDASAGLISKISEEEYLAHASA